MVFRGNIVDGYRWSFLLILTSLTVLSHISPSSAHHGEFSVIDYDANSVDTIASYKYITRNCTAGTIVGAVSATDATSYFITNGDPGFTISSAGLISLSTAVAAGRYLLSVQAKTIFGQTSTVLVKVTINCNLLSSASGATSVTINGTCLYDNCNFNYAAPVFSQSPYVFFPTLCGYNATMGSVSATGITTTNTAYWIESGPWVNYFFINPSTGTIIQLYPLPVGTLVTLTITAWNPNGVPTNVIVTINTTNCVYPSTASSFTTTTTTTTRGPTTIVYSPYFPLTAYPFTLSICSPGTIVGPVVATNAVSYYISSSPTQGSNLFSINSAGLITVIGTPTNGLYNLIVTAVSSQGLAVSVPVAITVTCSVTTTTVATVTTTTVATTTLAPSNALLCLQQLGAPSPGCSYNGRGTSNPNALTCAIICQCGPFDPNCNGVVTTNIEACMAANGAPNLGCTYLGTGTITPLTCPVQCVANG
ncbi:hypothetical protein RvY_07197-2 [Ramazzottius varieornatus]|uniref:Cadherin domain-containing protein n=1 Tax=Ramazzottius varieornatus TaxID=947166 RepID=A0A1D1V180_RAMVA|nr:hypothetical protein RvY_07197-2 [Ramazzottius varieornatus]